MFLCIASLVVFFFGIAMIITMAFDPEAGRIMGVVYAGIAALLFCMVSKHGWIMFVVVLWIYFSG